MICACRDITDLKEIQTDLHNIVQDQGEEIDRIGELFLWTVECTINMMMRCEWSSSNTWVLLCADVNVEKGAVRVEQGAKHAAVVSVPFLDNLC